MSQLSGTTPHNQAGGDAHEGMSGSAHNGMSLSPHDGQVGDGSPWWSADGEWDPWRDPQAPTVLVSRQVTGPPPLEPLEPQSQAMGGELVRSLVVAMVSALLAGTLGGALGYVFAARGGFNLPLVGMSDDRPAELSNRAPESMAGVVRKVLPSLV
nr:hypothetical protein [Longispora sp. (in: high G+C Gram-positive bacteria)]